MPLARLPAVPAPFRTPSLLQKDLLLKVVEGRPESVPTRVRIPFRSIVIQLLPSVERTVYNQ